MMGEVTTGPRGLRIVASVGCMLGCAAPPCSMAVCMCLRMLASS